MVVKVSDRSTVEDAGSRDDPRTVEPRRRVVEDRLGCRQVVEDRHPERSLDRQGCKATNGKGNLTPRARARVVGSQVVHGVTQMIGVPIRIGVADMGNLLRVGEDGKHPPIALFATATAIGLTGARHSKSLAGSAMRSGTHHTSALTGASHDHTGHAHGFT